MRKKFYKAYLTIEASFIIPLSFLLILLMLYWGFFCYEKSISIQCCYLAALRGANEWELSGTQLEEYTEKVLKELLDEKYLYQAEKEYRIDTNIMGIGISMNEYINIPFSTVEGEWTINSEKRAVRNKPSSYIRKYHMLKK